MNQRLARYVDVMIGNEEDFTACLGLEVEGARRDLRDLDTAAFRKMIEQAAQEFPNFAVVATTLRTVHSATVNDWSAIAWSPATGFVEATPRPGVEVSTALVVAIASPPALSSDFWRAKTCSEPSRLEPPTARS